jgi:hypothetical protein
MLNISFGAHSVMVDVTFSHYFYAKLVSVVPPSLLMACYVMFYCPLKCLSHPIKHLNSVPIFSAILCLLLCCMTIQCNIVDSGTAKPFEQFGLDTPMFITSHVLVCFESALHIKLVVQLNPDIHRMESGIAYAYAILLLLLSCLSTSLITCSF